MKTQTEIVIETIQFYLADPVARRAKTRGGSSCHYAMPLEPSCRCAVGRCMTEKAIKEFGSYIGGVDELIKAHGPLDRLLREEYSGHSQEFWFSLQVLHDADCYWTADDAATRRRELVRRCFPEALESCIALGLVADSDIAEAEVAARRKRVEEAYAKWPRLPWSTKAWTSSQQSASPPDSLSHLPKTIF